MRVRWTPAHRSTLRTTRPPMRRASPATTRSRAAPGSTATSRSACAGRRALHAVRSVGDLRHRTGARLRLRRAYVRHGVLRRARRHLRRPRGKLSTAHRRLHLRSRLHGRMVLRIDRGSCGGMGTCIDRGITFACATVCDPQCGCDGTSYDNECLRHKAAQSLSQSGTCPGDTPPCTMAGACCTTMADCVSGQGVRHHGWPARVRPDPLGAGLLDRRRLRHRPHLHGSVPLRLRRLVPASRHAGHLRLTPRRPQAGMRGSVPGTTTITLRVSMTSPLATTSRPAAKIAGSSSAGRHVGVGELDRERDRRARDDSKYVDVSNVATAAPCARVC